MRAIGPGEQIPQCPVTVPQIVGKLAGDDELKAAADLQVELIEQHEGARRLMRHTDLPGHNATGLRRRAFGKRIDRRTRRALRS